MTEAFAGPPRSRARQGECQINKELSTAEFLKDRPKNDKEDCVLRRDSHGDAIKPL